MPFKYVDFSKEELDEIIDSYLQETLEDEYDLGSIYSISDKQEDTEIRASPITMCLRYNKKAFTEEDLDHLEARLNSSMQYGFVL